MLADAADVLDLLGRPSEGAATRWEAQRQAELKGAVRMVERLRREPSGQGAEALRRVRIWLIGPSRSLVAGSEGTIGFQIGPSKDLATDDAKDLMEGDYTHHSLFIMLWTDHAEVRPNGHQVDFTRGGGTEPVYFTITPKVGGALRLRLRVHSSTTGDYLQEFAVVVPVEEHAKTASTAG